MKWESDLVTDIRTHSEKDDICDPLGFGSPYSEMLKRPKDSEFSKKNHIALQQAISACVFPPKYFLEIGVCRNGSESSTHTIVKNIPFDGKFFGIDIEDKSYLNTIGTNIHTLMANSRDYEKNVKWINSFGTTMVDFIHIDAIHTINQVLNDWEYTRLLTTGGVVAFHDVTAHPGPYRFINAIDTTKWEVYPNICPEDYGFGYCIKK